MANISANIFNWSQTAGSNQPDSGDTATVQADLQAVQAGVRGWLAHKGADIASATTTDIGAVVGLFHDITGTTTITGLGTVSAGIWKVLQFDGALTLTHNATSLIIPGGANITTAAGDMCMVTSEGSGNWRVNWYQRANGENIKLGANGADIASATTTVLDTATGLCVDVTGTTAITAITLAEGRTRIVRFTGALTLTHGASLVLPGSEDIETAAGDFAIFRGYASSVVRCVHYQRASGIPVRSTAIGTLTATTSGSSVDFTGLPSGTRRIIVSFNAISTDGTGDLLVQIGDAGGIENTSYVSSSGRAIDGSATAVTSSTSSFNVGTASTSALVSGQMILTLMDAASFLWASSHSVKVTSGTTASGGGNKTLSAELTQLRVLSADTFDNGSVNILYER